MRSIDDSGLGILQFFLNCNQSSDVISVDIPQLEPEVVKLSSMHWEEVNLLPAVRLPTVACALHKTV